MTASISMRLAQTEEVPRSTRRSTRVHVRKAWTGNLPSRERARRVPDQAVSLGVSRSITDKQIGAGPAIGQVTGRADDP
jgi:hypothetical protein